MKDAVIDTDADIPGGQTLFGVTVVCGATK